MMYSFGSFEVARPENFEVPREQVTTYDVGVSGSYKLQSGSPLINKGVTQPGTLAGATIDFWGDSLPKGGKYDIGIDEVA